MQKITALLTLSLLLAHAPMAVARDIIESTEAGRDFTSDCAAMGAKGKGRCISDAIKQWAREKQVFREQYDAEVRAWHLEHDGMGITPEYTKMLSDFLKTMQQKRRDFDAAQREARKKLFDSIKQAPRGPATNNGYSRPVTAQDEAAAKEKCKNQNDTTGLRICMRQQLRLTNPEARARGASSYRMRGQ